MAKIVTWSEEVCGIVSSNRPSGNFAFSSQTQCDKTFAKISLDFRIVLILQVVVASGERSFSQLKLIKSHKQGRLVDLATCLFFFSCHVKLKRIRASVPRTILH